MVTHSLARRSKADVTQLVLCGVLCVALCGCGVTAAIQGAGQQLGPAVSAIDTDVYAIALAKYQAAQMFKAQVDGLVALPPLSAPPVSVSGPTPPASNAPIPVVVMGTPVAGGLPLGPTGK